MIENILLSAIASELAVALALLFVLAEEPMRNKRSRGEERRAISEREKDAVRLFRHEEWLKEQQSQGLPPASKEAQ